MTRKLLQSAAVTATAAAQQLSPVPQPPASSGHQHDQKLIAFSLTALFVLACGCLAAYTWKRRRSSNNAVRPATHIPRSIEKQFSEQLKAIPVVIYSGGGASDAGEAECCTICLGDLVAKEEVRVLPKCGHFYHKACIDAWLCRRSTRCPVCRDVVIVANKI